MKVFTRRICSCLCSNDEQMRFDFLRAVSARKKGKEDPAAMVEEWAERHEGEIERFRGAILRAQGTSPLTPAILAQISSRARSLLQR